MITDKDWLKKWSVFSPGKVAVKELETRRKYTYQQLEHIANHLAIEFLNQHNLKKGDRIMILSEHCLEYVILFGIAQKIGVILVPVNYRLAASEINYLFGNCKPKLLICQEQFIDKVPKLSDSDASCFMWKMETFAQMGKAALSLAQKEVLDTNLVEDDDPLFILYTSGTTGFPKGAIYTHRMLFWNSINTTIGLNITADDITVLSMPPFHTGGWNVLLTPILHRGGMVSLVTKFDASLILNSLSDEKASIFMAVPTMLKMMSDSDEFEDIDLSTIRYFIVGGEALPLPIIERWHKKGVKLRQGYGLTEVGPNLTSLHQDDAIRKTGSIGKPNFYVESRIVDENNNAVTAGEIGEFCFKGNIVSPGYWQNDKATKQAILNGWFHTGDLVRMDDEGYLYVMDRKKNMFISGGENVYPAEVERIICQHPQVSEVAVTGVEDTKWGEVGYAFIKLESMINILDLKIFCQEHMAKFKVPKYFTIVDELPKTDSGKIDRKALCGLVKYSVNEK